MTHTYDKKKLIKSAKAYCVNLNKTLKDVEVIYEKNIQEAQKRRAECLKQTIPLLDELNAYLRERVAHYLYETMGKGCYERRRNWRKRLKGLRQNIKDLNSNNTESNIVKGNAITQDQLENECRGDRGSRLDDNIIEFLRRSNIDSYLNKRVSFWGVKPSVVECEIKQVEVLIKKLEIIKEDSIDCSFDDLDKLFVEPCFSDARYEIGLK